MNSKLRLALDLGPLLVFFLAYRFHGLLAATAALIVFTCISLTVTYLIEKKIAVMPLVSGIAVAVFGGMTLLLQDELFIKMKPTIVNMLFATILLGGVYFKKPLIKYLLGEAMQLEDKGWMILSRRWGIYFMFLAALNEFIWRNFSLDFWVNFKVFGMFTCTIIFTMSQIPLIKKYWIEPEKNS
ncbi:MAG: septation protein A [Alphaproteobacteria bacterium]